MTFDNQRLRYLTTGKLHTKVEHLYEDIGAITGNSGLYTHMLPRALTACLPWLKQHVTDPRFWDGKYDTTHTGETELPEPTSEDRAEMWKQYAALPNPLAGKDVIVVTV